MEIIVIGKQDSDDAVTLGIIAKYLTDHGQKEWADRLWKHDYVEYDMAQWPERGDAIDAINDQTELVIALHLYGIDHLPHEGWQAACKNPYMYAGRNGELLPTCMKRGIPFVCWGDQPWMGIERKTQINSNALWIYEPETEEAKR